MSCLARHDRLFRRRFSGHSDKLANATQESRLLSRDDVAGRRVAPFLLRALAHGAPLLSHCDQLRARSQVRAWHRWPFPSADRSSLLRVPYRPDVVQAVAGDRRDPRHRRFSDCEPYDRRAAQIMKRQAGDVGLCTHLRRRCPKAVRRSRPVERVDRLRRCRQQSVNVGVFPIAVGSIGLVQPSAALAWMLSIRPRSFANDVTRASVVQA